MSNYLSAPDLAELVGCRPNSYACMRRWLDRNGWPYAQSRIGMPIVSKAYHDARMAGEKTPSAPDAIEPDLSAFA
jgi:hypothetical protein